MFQQSLVRFLFPAESDRWLGLLRVGLGLEIVLYCLSLGRDWNYLLASTGHGLISRNLAEAIVDLDGRAVPRLGWLVQIGQHLGGSEQTTLSILWWSLLIAGAFLLVGLCCRTAAIAAWLLHLAAVKSSLLLAYGVDNFTTVGLFYLMLAPMPDRLALDRRLWPNGSQDRHLLGLFRRALQLHLCLIYFLSGVAKAIGLGWWTGANIWLALTRPPFDRIDPHLLARFKFTFAPAGIVIVLLEISFPFLIWWKRTRMFAVVIIIMMHVGIGLAMGMRLFALVMIVLDLAAFGPGFVRRRPSPGEDAIVDLAPRRV